MRKKLTTTKPTSLVELRNEGLKDIRSREVMQAHGKFLWMDTFSWISPKFDVLAKVLTSFPFSVIWIGTHDQMRCALKYYPEVLEGLETVIVYDQGNIKFEDEALVNIKNIVGTGDLESVWKIIGSLQEKKRVLFFTSEGENGIDHVEEFKAFIEK